ncbi:hypothetical protein Hanom_Chr12g01081991 [Helianthus anomalus]
MFTRGEIKLHAFTLFTTSKEHRASQRVSSVIRPGKRAGMGRVGSWFKTGSGQLENGLIWFGSGQVWVGTGFGSERVWVGTCFGSGWLKMFFKEIVHQRAILFDSKQYW